MITSRDLDIELDADPALARMIAAYGRWLGPQDGIA